MKVLVLSDSHGKRNYLREILQKEQSFDAVIHLGDGGADMLEMTEFTAGKPVYLLKGNCDPAAYDFSPRLISYFENIKFIACHGHTYNVKSDLGALFYASKEYDCTLALYGHTHIAADETYEGVRIINPGSAGSGRYCTLEINDRYIRSEHKQID